MEKENKEAFVRLLQRPLSSRVGFFEEITR
jgi:hypothetical protein